MMAETIDLVEGDEKDTDYLYEQMSRYNWASIQDPGEYPPRKYKTFVIKNDQEQIIAGVIVKLYRHYLGSIEKLWVDDKHRNQRLGETLLKAGEKWIIDNGGKIIYLETAGYRQLNFYLKHDYQIFGELKDCPAVIDGTIFYMEKRIK